MCVTITSNKIVSYSGICLCSICFANTPLNIYLLVVAKRSSLSCALLIVLIQTHKWRLTIAMIRFRSGSLFSPFNNRGAVRKKSKNGVVTGLSILRNRSNNSESRVKVVFLWYRRTTCFHEVSSLRRLALVWQSQSRWWWYQRKPKTCYCQACPNVREFRRCRRHHHHHP